MNILFINPPGKILFSSPPLGILYLAASLLAVGHNVWVKDYDLEKLVHEELIRFIKEKNIAIVGFSIVTPKISESIGLIKFIKKESPDIIILAGGPHITLRASEVLGNCPEINFAIQGEGELRIKKLVSMIESGQSPAEIDGVAYLKDGKVKNAGFKDCIDDLDALPFPARNLIDINGYAKRLKTRLYPATTMMTSRGCPFQCIYCSKPVMGYKFRARSPENIIFEIETLINDFNIKEIIFYDDSFTLNRERTLKICNLILKKKIKISWQCETRVNLVDLDLLIKMKSAGCYQIAYGIESGSDRVLGILKKGITKKQIKKAVAQTKKAGLQIIGYFMLGIPGETEQEIEQTIKFSTELDIDYAQFSIATAYPGTELFQIAQANDKITPDWSKSFYALGETPAISLSEVPLDKISLYVKKAYRSFYFRPAYVLKRLSQFRSFNDALFNFRGLINLIRNI